MGGFNKLEFLKLLLSHVLNTGDLLIFVFQEMGAYYQQHCCCENFDCYLQRAGVLNRLH